MKKLALLSFLVALGLALFSGCASMQTRGALERSAEDKMVVIQEEIGDGMKTGALTPDQSQMYLATLKGIQADYAGLGDKNVTREEWNSLEGRLDVLGQVVNRALGRTKKDEKPANSLGERFSHWAEWFVLAEKNEEPTRAERIVTLQMIIDDGRVSGSFSLQMGSEFQARLDSIRGDYLRMMEGGRSVTSEEKAEISSRLDSLQSDLNHLPQL
jgi:hypothetical protein